jgi:hypothetical protein
VGIFLEAESQGEAARLALIGMNATTELKECSTAITQKDSIFTTTIEIGMRQRGSKRIPKVRA